MNPITFILLALSTALVADVVEEPNYGEPPQPEPLLSLLVGPGEYPPVGPEFGSPKANGVAKFASPHGSVRYLLYSNGVPISALQVVSRDGRHATIANVITVAGRRREGLALQLLQRARRDFETVTHSTDLSKTGGPWAQAVETVHAPLGLPEHRFTYWAACPDLTAEIIHYITDDDRARPISYTTFASRVDLSQLREQDHPAMYRISAPDNWAIHFYRSTLPSGRPIYFFDWSRIEHIFVDFDRGMPDIADETRRARVAGYA